MLNAKSEEKVNKLCSLAALFIYANKQEITKEKIMAVLKELNVDVQSKLADYFVADVIKMKEMLSSISNVSGSSAPTDAVKETKEKEPEAKVEEEVEDVEIDFGDLF